jgi:hypothetical protein
MNNQITIIVPTRERSDVLQYCLRTLAAQNSDRINIIVSDNSSIDETRDVYDAIADERFRYVRTSKRISMSDNWDFAMSHVSGGFVGFIGDDDGILPGAIERLSTILHETDADAIRTETCSFTWPQVLKATSGRLLVPVRRGHEWRDSKLFLNNVMLKNAHYTNLPVIYNGGLVRYKILNSVKEIYGRFFYSAIPDVFSGISIAKQIPRYFYSARPEFINGASVHSNGTSQMTARIKAPARRFLSEGNMPYHQDVPMCRDGSYPPSLIVFALESYLRVFNLSDADRIKLFKLVAATVIAERSPQQDLLSTWAIDFCKMHNIQMSASATGRFFTEISRIYHVIKRDLTLYEYKSLDNSITNVFEASKHAEEIVNQNLAAKAAYQSLNRLTRQILRKFGSPKAL